MRIHRTVILATGAWAFVLAASSVRAEESSLRRRSMVSYDPQGTALAAQASEERFLSADDEDEDDADPVLARLYLRKAQAAKEGKEFDTARKHLMRALQFDKTNERVWTELAWVCNELKRYDEGGAAAVAAILLNKRNAEAWREAGYALLKKGEHEKAIEALQVAKRLAPSDVSTAGYLKQARAALREAEESVPVRSRERDDN